MTKTIIQQVRDLNPKDIKANRQKMLNLARWICEYFGYKIVKNVPETVVIKRTIPPKKEKLKVDEKWIDKFRARVLDYKENNYEQYQKRVRGQRV